jgi:hypothetical protein
MLAPGSRRLWNNGIMQSGALENKWAMDTPERAFEKSWQLVVGVGCESPGRQNIYGTLSPNRQAVTFQLSSPV